MIASVWITNDWLKSGKAERVSLLSMFLTLSKASWLTEVHCHLFLSDVNVYRGDNNSDILDHMSLY